MFIRPVGATVRPAQRPAGHPLLRGLLARAAGAAQDTTGAMGPAEPPRRGLLARAVQAAQAPAEPEPELMPEPEPEPEPWPEEEGGGGATAAPTTAAPAPTPLVAELRQLADLAREGLLTPQEFTAAKARLLRD
ncbi:SHOCT domain-containing protein [Streptomyces sp. NBC_01233]|uniref:SHOCT domain-containing protein n=1 Tax=Streptomyces sp. NBC_01233 TaxID=2903787 RepID=UPI002E156FA3|nr:SHOCT domain-containing protein [Streptomyces sp. NBC_01233]